MRIDFPEAVNPAIASPASKIWIQQPAGAVAGGLERGWLRRASRKSPRGSFSSSLPGLLVLIPIFLAAGAGGIWARAQVVEIPVATVSGHGVQSETAELPDAPLPVPEKPMPDKPDPARPFPGVESAGSDLAVDTSASAPSSSSSIFGATPAAIQPAQRYVPLDQCPFDTTHARECRVHIKPLVISSVLFNAFQNTGNLYTGYWYRYETTTGKWWDRYVNSVEDWRWKQWSDNNPFLDDYVGHPIMGAITDDLWIQNDPKGMTLEQGNNWPYWRSRLRAEAFTTFYSFEWKLGPLGEAGIGHNGDHYYEDQGTVTNETGWVELVTTPVGGLGWTLAEDFLDKHVVRRLEEKSRNPLLLTLYQFLTPARGFDNILRFRSPWYRDSRVVKAKSFWSDPGDGVTATTWAGMEYAKKHGGEEASGVVSSETVERATMASPNWEGPGGKHEFGAWWGLSLISGHIWGYAGGVKYMPIDLRYSYELGRHRDQWALRYSPELTAMAMIDWPTPKGSKPMNLRERVYGSGVSPVGFQWDFLPLHQVQPFLSTDGGFIYFGDRVLSPQGSQFMYTIDYGAGFNFFRHEHQAVTIGYRYQHLSNANISLHNPGTDANTFYVGISRFRTRGRKPRN